MSDPFNLPDDMGLLGALVENVSYKNAVEYFPMEV
ncbi:MAG: glucuronate isomerase [Phycisphaerae bacterium]|nr:glucuronate isomerase [Phycisphaerae bacterium]